MLALFRAELASFCRDPRFALYSPLSFWTRHDVGFALHADLYLPELLLNIFDKVPTDASGASLFLSAGRFQAILHETSSVPLETRNRIASYLKGTLRSDGFDDLYDLLHGQQHEWVRTIHAQMARRSFASSFIEGRGI